jgi:hypothetical protein
MHVTKQLRLDFTVWAALGSRHTVSNTAASITGGSRTIRDFFFPGHVALNLSSFFFVQHVFLICGHTLLNRVASAELVTHVLSVIYFSF